MALIEAYILKGSNYYADCSFAKIQLQLQDAFKSKKHNQMVLGEYWGTNIRFAFVYQEMRHRKVKKLKIDWIGWFGSNFIFVNIL